MTSRRFSLIDASMELNFCFTCFRGSLLNSSRETSHIVQFHTFSCQWCTQPPRHSPTPRPLLPFLLRRLHSSSPHVCQELLKHLLPVYGPKLKAAWRVAGVGDALVQGPVLIESQTEAEDTESSENYRVDAQTRGILTRLKTWKDTRIRMRFSCSRLTASCHRLRSDDCVEKHAVALWQCLLHTSC